MQVSAGCVDSTAQTNLVTRFLDATTASSEYSKSVWRADS